MGIVAVSGGFDPLHPGHVDLFKAARSFGSVFVILNSDEWLTRKKGKPFMDFATRKRLIEAVKWVTAVVPALDDDGTVTRSLARLRPMFFANGGDRGQSNTPEVDFCQKNGIKLLFGLENTATAQIHSSHYLTAWTDFQARR